MAGCGRPLVLALGTNSRHPLSPTYTTHLKQARQIYQAFREECSPSIARLHEFGIPKICTVRILEDYLLYFTAYREKDLSVCICTDKVSNVFLVKQLFDAVQVLR